MAQVKTIRTYNGAALHSKSWNKLNLGGTLAKEHEMIVNAQKAFNQHVVKAIAAAQKIDLDKYDVLMSFRFGPSYTIADKVTGTIKAGTLAITA